MLISHPRKFLFVHIYKNAGTSISAALLPHAVYNPAHLLAVKICKRLNIPLPFALDPLPMYKHSSASQIVEKLGRQVFSSCFSFAFVRNPWDWQVSLYNYVLRHPKNRHYDIISGFKGFDEYIRWRCDGNERFQKEFIYDGNQTLVNFVGRYENLEADFRKICERIGIQAELPTLNVSKTKPYQEYYVPETIELVRKTFAPDIELFEYDFE